MKPQKSLISTIQLSTCFLMTLLVMAIGFLWIQEELKQKKTHEEKIHTTFLNAQKDTIKKDVDHVVHHIHQQRKELRKRARKQVKSRARGAHQIAQSLYEKNKGKMSLDTISTLIQDTLSALSWNNGESVYFIKDMTGTTILNHKNLDLNDKNNINTILEVARSKEKEGYTYWNSPENPTQHMSYIKYFKPLNWIIGTSINLKNGEERLKQEIFNHIETIHFSADKYIFVGTLEGVSQSGPEKGKNMWNITDANGLKVVQKLIETAKNGGGFVHYVMPKLKGQKPSPKISYSALIPEWNWYIGTGVYVDFIENEIAKQQEVFDKSIQNLIIKAVIVLSLFLLLSCFLVWLFARKIKTNLYLFVNFFKKSAFEQLPIPPEKIAFSEFQALALLANQMVEDHQHTATEKKQSEEKFRKIIENISDVYYETGLDGTIYYCSPSCLDFSGYSQAELIGNNASILYNNPDDRAILLKALQKTGKSRDLELIFKKKNGDLYDVSFNADFSLDEDGKPTRLYGTIRDITATKKLTEQVQRSKKMAAIGLMAGGVAHDLNNILSAIVGYPEMLLMTLPEDSNLRKPIQAIQESGQRAATVVDDLLTVARGVASTRETYDLNFLIKEYIKSPECEQLRSLYPLITFHTDFMALRSTVSCSPVHIKKCLMNLVMNAAEAMVDSGTISVTTYNQFITDADNEPDIATGEYIIISVQDTGSGISETDLEHIFEPFYTKKIMGRSGTGLGLAIVWNTVQDHNGKILIESNDTGTQFQLYFPLTTDEIVQIEEETTTTLTGNNEHILIVDDEAAIRDISSNMLQSLGYIVNSVPSGEEAIKFIQKRPVDLVILDMIMDPGLNGLETYTEILKHNPETKALIISGFSNSDDVKATLKLGASRFIKKPYSIAQLSQAVKAALEN